MSAAAPRWRTVAALGSAQTLAWGSSYYLPAVLAAPMARDLGLATPAVYAVFSFALIVSALVGPAAGRWIDRHGGRSLLLATNAVFALGLALLAFAHGPLGLVVAWVVLGIAMGSGLYEAAFSTLVRLHGGDSRNMITGITLIAGFASTIGWPLSAWMESQFGWRSACLGWAALHVVLGAPLNALVPRAGPPPSPPPAHEPAAATGSTLPAAAIRPMRTTVLLSIAFAVSGFIATIWAAHLPGLLQTVGASAAVAIGVGALIGPAQVAARLFEFGVLRRVHPLLSARLAAAAHPLGIAVLLVAGVPAALLFALLHGAGNGMMTIAKGTLPLALFGPAGYGARQGWLMMPMRIAAALSPAIFGLVIESLGAGALWVSGVIGLGGLAALLALRMPATPARKVNTSSDRP
jgi:MFS family permease